MGVVDRSENQALAGGHAVSRHGAKGAAGEVVVEAQAAAAAEPHALDQSEGLFLGKAVGDRVDRHETEVDSDLVPVMAHLRVDGEFAAQWGVEASDSRRPRGAAARARRRHAGLNRPRARVVPQRPHLAQRSRGSRTSTTTKNWSLRT
ncbi:MULTISPECIES: hypothetical protein [unclassified Streptomyces]|uniref:hypothetical protein n=1 Tax=unclassified Streptomyces TaxID=2593676 RepID=UPI0011AF5A84|nr:hypothetical protein [Streptomyces sp. CB02959]